MTLAQCRELVEQADPDRALVLRMADDAAQARLYPLYALNIEIARAAWASAEPLVAEMRLQWWRDALHELTTDRFARAHPVLSASGFLAGDGAAGALFDEMIEARRWDIWREPFADAAALWDHLGATGGALMQLAGRALGVEEDAALREFGTVTALAGWFQAVPDLIARGRHPLPDPAPQAIAALARQGLDRLVQARSPRPSALRPALPALLTGWETGPILTRAARQPEQVLQAPLTRPELRRRTGLFLRALSGRW